MLKRLIYPLLLVGLLIGAWELSASLSPEHSLLFPPPSRYLLRLIDQAGVFSRHSWMTLREMLVGMGLACTLAFPLAWLMVRFTWARLALQPLFVGIQCLPMFTLAPLMVLIFGWSFSAIVIPTALMIFFPLTLNIYQGIRATPLSYLEFFRCHNASRWQIFWKLRLPFALPHIFAGLRVSSAIAGVGAIAGEWAGAQEGLGVLILEFRRNMDLEGVFAALACLMMISLSTYSSAIALEQWSLRRRRVLA